MPRKYSRRNSLKKKSLKRKSLKRKSLKRKSFKKRSFRRRSLRGGAEPELVDLRRRLSFKICPDQMPPGGETTQPRPQLETVGSNLSNTSSEFYTPREGNENEQSFDFHDLPLTVAENMARNLNARDLRNFALSNRTGADVARNPDVRTSASRNTAIERLKQDGLKLENYPEYSNDREVVLAAVSNHGQALYYASDELKNNKEVVVAAVHNDGWALVNASPRLKADRGVVLTAVSNRGYAS